MDPTIVVAALALVGSLVTGSLVYRSTRQTTEAKVAADKASSGLGNAKQHLDEFQIVVATLKDDYARMREERDEYRRALEACLEHFHTEHDR